MTRVYTCPRPHCVWTYPVHYADAEHRVQRHISGHERAEAAEDEAWQWIEQRKKETGT